jgi:hypothetical protein
VVRPFGALRALGLVLAALALPALPRAAASQEAPLLTLIFPNSPTGITLETRRPRFVWSSAPVPTPPGPWLYDIEIVNVASRETVTARQLTDTTFLPSFDLESNTSYRWAVTARLSTGDSVRVESLGTFVIVDAQAPLVTLLYQNFPNPFPNARSATTCVWFDLRSPSVVRLDVYDLRGNHVRTLVPSADVPGQLPAGRYGRAAPASNTGCDARFSWDGRADDGRDVPSGVYLLRMRADGVDATRKMLYRGR